MTLMEWLAVVLGFLLLVAYLKVTQMIADRKRRAQRRETLLEWERRERSGKW